MQITGRNEMAETSKTKTYRVFPDYCATGVWGEIGDNPYVIYEEQLKQMGASMETIYLLRKMQYVFEMSNRSYENRFRHDLDYIDWAKNTAARRLTEETGSLFRPV